MEQTVTEVCSVFDETVLSLKVLCLVIEQAVDIEEVKTVFGADMAYLFHEHVYLESQYDRLLSAASIAGVVLQEDADKMVKLAQQVKDSFRLICRFIRRNLKPLRLFKKLPFDVLEHAASLPAHKPWSKLAVPLSQYMEIVVRRLNDSAEAGEKNEMDPETVLLHLEMTRRHCQDRCTRFQGVLDDLTRKRNERRAQGDKVMQGLKQERARLLQRVRSERGVAKELIDKDINELEKQAMETKTSVEDTCKKHMTQLEKDGHKHQEQEFLLLRRTRFMNVETEKIIADYDEKMISLTKKTDAAEKQKSAEKIRNEELKAKVGVLVADRLKWEAVLAERRRVLEEEMARLDSACIVIQRAFRSYLERRPPRKKKKGKTKGKKKK